MPVLSDENNPVIACDSNYVYPTWILKDVVGVNDLAIRALAAISPKGQPLVSDDVSA